MVLVQDEQAQEPSWRRGCGLQVIDDCDCQRYAERHHDGAADERDDVDVRRTQHLFGRVTRDPEDARRDAGHALGGI